MATPRHPPDARSGPASSGWPCARARRIGAACAALASAVVLACGYAVTTHYRAKGGAEHVFVRPFENVSREAGVGAEVATALRSELSRRGAEGGPGASAVIDGEVRTGDPVPSMAGGAAFRIALEVHARLVVGGAVLADRVIRREADYLAGADGLESEGRRALALRQLATDAAREILADFEG